MEDFGEHREALSPSATSRQSQREVVKPIVERLAGDRNAKLAHVGEVGRLQEGLRSGLHRLCVASGIEAHAI